MQVYSIVVTYNGAEWIDRCFGSLQQSIINGDHHIIVIDNGSKDETVHLIRKNYPDVEIIESVKNLGFGAANNLGIIKALNNKADYVFLLNQDAWIENDTIQNMITIQNSNPSFGILSPIQMHPKGGVEKGFSNYLNNKQNIKYNSDIIETEFVNAAIWLVATKLIRQIGCFDPFYFHYGEDFNFCYRTIFQNYKIGICDKLTGYHDRELSTKNSKLLFQSSIKNDLINLEHNLFVTIAKVYLKLLKIFIITFLKKNFIYSKWVIAIGIYIPFQIFQIRKSRKKVEHVHNM